jgi:ubiquinone/menaquinone biosynthesis C-methylase UbiE
MKNILLGNNMDRMPDSAFWMMKQLFKIFYFFRPVDKYIGSFGIKKGDTVVDYGCGPGAYIKSASILAGEKGTVYAVDIHEMAISAVIKLIAKENLKNVRPVLADSNRVSIPDDSADVVYAIDMFHMVKDSEGFLKEICRITKNNGFLILEDGHQPRKITIEKVLRAGCWKISGEQKRYIKCSPEKHHN